MEKFKPIGSFKDVLPYDLRKEIYDKLISARNDENWNQVGYECTVPLRGSGFQLILTNNKVIHIAFAVPHEISTTGAVIFCLDRDNLELLIKE